MAMTLMRKNGSLLPAVAGGLGVASVLMFGLHFPTGGPCVSGKVAPLLELPEESFALRERAAKAVAKYEAAKPLRASDHFHRWRFDALKGVYSNNSTLHSEVSRLQTKADFRRAFPGSPALFFRSPFGWEVRQRTPKAAAEKNWQYEYHFDQFIATCAEIGVPLSLVIEADGGQVTVGDLLEASRLNFDLSQELCWTLVAYCIYLPEESKWTNRFGESCSYESMIEQILSLRLDDGSCGGTHKQFALAYFLSSKASGELSANLRSRCEECLARASELLQRSQLPSGAWSLHWAGGPPSALVQQPAPPIHGSDLVRVTGHVIEWVSIAPAALRLPNASVSRGLQFLAEALDRASLSDIEKDYCAYSHAARVLECSLRNRRSPGRHPITE